MSYYSEIKKHIAKGWNTWNTRSVLSHVLLPEGFAINLGIKEYKDGYYLKEALIGKFGELDEKIHPGAHAYDGSYTELNLKWRGIELIVQSGTQDDDLLLLVTPVASQPRSPLLIIESGMLWNHPGSLMLEGNTLLAQTAEKTIMIHTTGKVVRELSVATQTPHLAVVLDAPVGICTGRKRDLDEIAAVFEKNKLAHFQRSKRYGELAEVYHAMQTCMAWDTIYEPMKDRVITPVSRLWSIYHGGYILFCWDNFFAAYMASLDNKELAYSNAIEMTREKTKQGFVPNCAWGNGFTSLDRSQPPVGSIVVRELYRKYRDQWFIEELFEDLYNWNTWFTNNRRLDSGAMAWGSNPYPAQLGNYWETAGVNQTYGGALESGLDNSPMYDDIPFDAEKHVMKLADVGLTGLYIMDCEALADIASVLNRTREAAELKNRSLICQQGLTELWSDTSGIYLNKRTDTDEFSLRMSPTNFYALFGDSVSPAQAERMLSEHFYNPEEFWGDWMMPSIARNDTAYKEQEYWRGRIWAPMNFLVYLSFRKNALLKPCNDLAEKSRNLILKEWLKHGHVHENYNAETGEGCDKGSSDKFYHWGGLLSMIALMEAGFVEGPENPIS